MLALGSRLPVTVMLALPIRLVVINEFPTVRVLVDLLNVRFAVAPVVPPSLN